MKKLKGEQILAGSNLKIQPVAFDSFGVKGMCTAVQTPDISILIDPGVSAQSEQFPLPSALRQELLNHYEAEVFSAAKDAEIIIISHYHLDHFLDRRDPALYGDKIVLAKSPEDLPEKQKETARRFFQKIDGLPREIIWADGRRFRFKKTEIGFSPPLWHGKADAEPGRVIMTEVTRGREKFLVSSDIAGPVADQAIDLISAVQPQIAFIDGYPTFLESNPGTELSFIISLLNITYLLLSPFVKTLVIDHHLARDYRYPALFKPLYRLAEKMKKKLGTAAEILGRRSAVMNGLESYGTTRWHHWQPLEAEIIRTIVTSALSSGKIEPRWLANRLQTTPAAVTTTIDKLYE